MTTLTVYKLIGGPYDGVGIAVDNFKVCESIVHYWETYLIHTVYADRRFFKIALHNGTRVEEYMQEVRKNCNFDQSKAADVLTESGAVEVHQ
ncbi:MAG: hypothetical protein ACRDCE_05625 [Cetobacterium sp.]|uniref:hypothetical protein n=1 Tax=Cetobacterium sp. TaxID=2071632 RepID=UPI003EE600D1